MKEILKLIGVLTIISAGAGVLLALTNSVTMKPIAEARRQETLQALSRVLPPFDNQPDADTKSFTEDGVTWTFYVARKAKRFAGTAFTATSRKGYGGPITLMAGLSGDGTLRTVQILSQQETPGLGTKITVPPFSKQFDERSIDGAKWAVKKDGGDFDAITGATISSRAVLEAIRGGLDVYRKHKDDLATPEA
jgi:Na+-translocating ferredoxin:NAD+ oxidoreductase subunit G